VDHSAIMVLTNRQRKALCVMGGVDGLWAVNNALWEVINLCRVRVCWCVVCVMSRHGAMLEYLTSQGEAFQDTAAAFRREAELEDAPAPSKLRKNLLEKKWTAVVRLQKKVRCKPRH